MGDQGKQWGKIARQIVVGHKRGKFLLNKTRDLSNTRLEGSGLETRRCLLRVLRVSAHLASNGPDAT
eukprot:723095-Heterocapsa_arctica.AAC.1